MISEREALLAIYAAADALPGLYDPHESAADVLALVRQVMRPSALGGWIAMPISLTQRECIALAPLVWREVDKPGSVRPADVRVALPWNTTGQ